MAAKKKTTKGKAIAKKATKSKAKAKKTKSIDSISQAHGKEDKFQPTTLDQIWGDTGMSKYRTLDEDKYNQEINDLSKVDLQAHAAKIGLIPIDNSAQLRKRLLAEFRKYASVYKAPIHAKKEQKTLSKEAMKILNEGK